MAVERCTHNSTATLFDDAFPDLKVRLGGLDFRQSAANLLYTKKSVSPKGESVMYNPPPPGYNAPYGATPPPQVAMTSQLPGAEPGAKSSLGIDGNLSGALAYIGPFNIIFAIMEKDNRFVRFNAFQSLLAGVTLLVIDLVLIAVFMVLGFLFIAVDVRALGAIMFMLLWLVVMAASMIFLAGIIMAAVKAYNRQMYKLPLVGNWAESIVRKM